MPAAPCRCLAKRTPPSQRDRTGSCPSCPARSRRTHGGAPANILGAARKEGRGSTTRDPGGPVLQRSRGAPVRRRQVDHSSPGESGRREGFVFGGVAGGRTEKRRPRGTVRTGSPAEHLPDAPYLLSWFRPRPERPRCRRATKQADEVAPSHMVLPGPHLSGGSLTLWGQAANGQPLSGKPDQRTSSETVGMSRTVESRMGAVAWAIRQATLAIDHVRRGRNGEALRAWRDLFGPKFPLS
jgi:hypothetical protein